jgi:hypothetical protein
MLLITRGFWMMITSGGIFNGTEILIRSFNLGHFDSLIETLKHIHLYKYKEDYTI